MTDICTDNIVNTKYLDKQKESDKNFPWRFNYQGYNDKLL